MTLDELLAQLCQLGYTLRTFSGPNLHRPLRYRWEATVSRPLDDGAYAIGYWSAPTPIDAISRALHLCATDFETAHWALSIPTCAPPDDIADQLANLLTPSAITMSPPKFKLKAP